MSDETGVESRASRRHWSFRIGFKILAVAVVSSVLPILVIGLFTFIKLKSDLIDQAAATQTLRVAAMVRGIDILMKSYGERAESLAESIAVQSMDPVRQSTAMHAFLDLNPLFYSCYGYLADGLVVSSAYTNRVRSQEEDKSGWNLLENDSSELEGIRKAFREVKASRRTMIADRAVDTGRERLLMILSPVFDFTNRDTVKGVLSCAIRIDGPAVDDILGDFPLADDEVMILADGAGRVMASSGPTPAGLLSIDVKDRGTTGSGPAGFFIGNTRYLGVLAPVSRVNGFVLSGRPRSVVLGFLDEVMLNFGLVTMVALATAFFLSYLLSSQIALRLEGLAEGIRLVSQGKVSHRIDQQGQDEISEAAKAFNDMAGALEKHRILEEIWTGVTGGRQE